MEILVMEILKRFLENFREDLIEICVGFFMEILKITIKNNIFISGDFMDSHRELFEVLIMVTQGNFKKILAGRGSH